MDLPIQDDRAAAALSLLGGLSVAAFMRRHWQRKPLLVRQALPGVRPPTSRASLFRLAARDGVESRLVVRDGERWSVRHGPLPRRALPPLTRPGWTLLVQGLDLHLASANELMSRFRFVGDARMDDLMMSWASDGAGVGPHLDAYDVFLIQVHGRRRWRIGRSTDVRFVEGLPLRILRRFEPEQEWVLDPGDMLYLPPRWAHDGIAVGECMTCSVGFRAPAGDELARAILARMADADPAGTESARYRDAGMPATTTPARIPERLQRFAGAAVSREMQAGHAIERALGEWLSEPKPQVWFEASPHNDASTGVRLARATRMLYDAHHLYVNGESFRMSGRDAASMRRLADHRELDGASCAALSPTAHEVVAAWLLQGWLEARPS